MTTKRPVRFQSAYVTLLLRHKPLCGLTRLTGGQVDLHRLGIFPVQCAGCGDLLPSDHPAEVQQ
jgi:hypothetical protein